MARPRKNESNKSLIDFFINPIFEDKVYAKYVWNIPKIENILLHRFTKRSLCPAEAGHLAYG